MAPLLVAAPCQEPAHPLPAIFLTCGRGGTGRRAALRSLWPKGRGSSSLLDRTRLERTDGVLRVRRKSTLLKLTELRRGDRRTCRGQNRQWSHRNRPEARDRLVR